MLRVRPSASRSSQALLAPRRRLGALSRHLSSVPRPPPAGDAAAVMVDLGAGVHVRRRAPRDPRLVPRGFLPEDLGRAIPEVGGVVQAGDSGGYFDC
jgi:hypothetical protein